jgi:hypothetical protein
MTGCAKSLGLGETHEHKDIIERVNATADHHVAMSSPELKSGEVKSGKTAGTGSVNNAVGAAQVKAVGYAPSDYIAKQTGEGVFLPRHILSGDLLGRGLSKSRIDPYFLHGLDPLGMSESRA